jgi:hypothetical protein
VPVLGDPKWEAFCRSIAQFPNRSYAEHYQRAGFDTTGKSWQQAQQCGARIFYKAAVKKRIAELREVVAIAPSHQAIDENSTKEDILRALFEVVNRCMQAAPAFDKQGNPTGYFAFDPRNAVLALRTAFELQGANLSVLFRREQKGSKKQELEKMSAEELVRLGRSIAARLSAASGGDLDAPDAGAQRAASLQATPQAEGVSRPGGGEARADPHGGQPVREIASRWERGGDASDGPLPEVVEGPEISQPRDDVGGWTHQ